MTGNATIGALRVVLGLDSAQFENGLKGAQTQLRRAGREITAIGEEISRAGAALSVGLTVPLALFGRATIKAASDANEMQSAFKYVFGSSAREVEAWAKTTGDALGRSTFVLQEQALAFQQLFKQAAPTEQAAAGMSKQFTLLAQDLASFYNVTEDDALLKLRSGLVGEAEPLRAFGVFLTEAAVAAKGLQLGLAKTSKELTEQDKIMARAALITEATKDAQGDAARTSDSFANRSKALTAQLNELQVSLGTALLPALTSAANAATGCLSAFNALSPGAQQAGLAIAGVAAAVGPMNLLVGGLVGAAGRATEAMAGLTASAGGLRAAATALTGVLGAGGVLTLGLAAAGLAAFALYKHFKDLKTASAQVTQQTDALSSATDAYVAAANLASTASGEARVQFLKEAAAKRELNIQTRDSAAAKLADARATLVQLQAQNAQAIASDRFNFRGDAAGTIKPTLNAGKVSKAQANVDALEKSITSATDAIARADKVLAAGAAAGARGAEQAAAGISRKAVAIDKEARALESAKDSLREYVAAQKEELATRDMTSEQVKVRELQARATEAIRLGMMAELTAILALIDAYRDLQIEVVKLNDLQVDFVNTPKDLATAIQDMERNAKPSIEDVADEFYRIGNAVDDVFYGIADNDWVGAFSGLTRALGQVKEAFGAAGTQAQKYAAIAGVGSAVGGAVGGKIGGAISGAASGFAAGNMLLPGIGGVIGGVLGGLGGLFGASKAKKRAKKQAAEQARLEAERKAAEVAATKRALELEILDLSGDRVGALAEARKDELAAMDPSVRALQEQAWAARDAAEMTAQRTAIERELLRLQNDDAALAADRADALAALDPALRPLQQRLYDYIDALKDHEKWADIQAQADADLADARETLADVAEAESDRLKDLAARFGDLADGLAAVGRELSSGPLADLDIKAQARMARAEFDRISALAATGDEKALEDLPDAIRNFVETQRAIAPNRAAFDAQLAVARRAAAVGEAAARAQVTDAELQLAALEAQTGHLIEVRDATLSVGQAVKNVETLLSIQAGVMASTAASLERINANFSNPVNDNLSGLTASQGFDAAAVSAATVTAVAAPGALTSDVNLARDIAKALEPMLGQIVLQTGAAAATLDDVSRGSLTLNVVAA